MKEYTESIFTRDIRIIHLQANCKIDHWDGYEEDLPRDDSKNQETRIRICCGPNGKNQSEWDIKINNAKIRGDLPQEQMNNDY